MGRNREQNAAAAFFEVLDFVVPHAQTPMLFQRQFVFGWHTAAGRVIEVNVRRDRYTADIEIRLRSTGLVIHPDVNGEVLVRHCRNSVSDAIPCRKEDWPTIKSDLCTCLRSA